MFQDAFKHEVALLTSNKHLQEKLLTEVNEHYSHKNRYYHNLQHLDYLLQQLASETFN